METDGERRRKGKWRDGGWIQAKEVWEATAAPGEGRRKGGQGSGSVRSMGAVPANSPYEHICRAPSRRSRCTGSYATQRNAATATHSNCPAAQTAGPLIFRPGGVRGINGWPSRCSPYISALAPFFTPQTNPNKQTRLSSATMKDCVVPCFFLAPKT